MVATPTRPNVLIVNNVSVVEAKFCADEDAIAKSMLFELLAICELFASIVS